MTARSQRDRERALTAGRAHVRTYWFPAERPETWPGTQDAPRPGMANAKRTVVSKSNPAIKAILQASFPEWRGRRVTVVEADARWESRHYCDDYIKVVAVEHGTKRAIPMPAPGYTSGPVTHYAREGVALVMLFPARGKTLGDVEIVVRTYGDALEYFDLNPTATLAVALDAALAAGPKGAAKAAADVLGANSDERSRRVSGLGVYAAVVEAQAAALEKAAAVPA